MARKPKHEEHENHERWLVSYADFITLLFAFFVVMYSISSVNEGKYRVLSDAIVAAFQSPQKSLKPIQVGVVARSPQSASLEFTDTSTPIKVPESPMRMPSRANKLEGEFSQQEVDFSEFPMAEERFLQQESGSDGGQTEADKRAAEMQLSSLATEVEMAMQPLIDRDLISVKRYKRWIEVEINTSILFSSGSAHMHEQSLPILEALARILSAFPNKLRVEGFTDNVAIKSQLYPSNWELSAARAATVVRLFANEGIEPERMAAIGYGEFRPIVSNDTREGRIKNRRVVIVITANRQIKREKSRMTEKSLEPEIRPQDEALETNGSGVEGIEETGIDKTGTEAVGVNAMADDGGFARLDALIESSGLHRKTPIVFDQLQATPSLIEDSNVTVIPIIMQTPLMSPPIKFRSPILLPSMSVSGHSAIPAGTIAEGE